MHENLNDIFMKRLQMFDICLESSVAGDVAAFLPELGFYYSVRWLEILFATGER